MTTLTLELAALSKDALSAGNLPHYDLQELRHRSITLGNHPGFSDRETRVEARRSEH